VHPAVPQGVRADRAPKSKPGTLTFSSGGNGTPAHIAGQLFKSLAKVDMVHVRPQGRRPGRDRVIGRRSVAVIRQRHDR
jgi:tripartite-type tricarboxylate transporter receptor subunit TctC